MKIIVFLVLALTLLSCTSSGKDLNMPESVDTKDFLENAVKYSDGEEILPEGEVKLDDTAEEVQELLDILFEE